MLNKRVTAIFNSKDDAERVVKELRSQGVADDHVSILTKHSSAGEMAAGAGSGLATGGVVGALFGLSAALIPGIGPFIAAGFLAPMLGAVGGAAAAGAVVGGTAGLIAGALSKAGYNDKEAEFYGKELEDGRVLLAVDTGAAIDDNAVNTIVGQYGGRRFDTNQTPPTI